MVWRLTLVGAVSLAARTRCGSIGGVCLLLLVLCSGVANAVCVPPAERPRPDDPHQYIGAVIDSLVSANQAELRAERGPDEALLLQLKRAQGDYRCARDKVRPYTESTDHFIRKSADAITIAYAAIIELNGRFESTTVAWLNEPTPRGGSYMNQIAEFAAGENETLLFLGRATISALYAIVKFGDGGEGTGRLRITKAQRHDLIAQLQNNFGETVTTAGKSQPDTVPAAKRWGHLMYKFLADSNWRSSDD